MEETKKGWSEEKRQTFSRVAVLGSMTLRMSRVSWVREVPTWPCFMTKDLGTLSRDDVEDCGPFKWVRFLRLRAIDDNDDEVRAGTLKYTWINQTQPELFHDIYTERKQKKIKK